MGQLKLRTIKQVDAVRLQVLARQWRMEDWDKIDNLRVVALAWEEYVFA